MKTDSEDIVLEMTRLIDQRTWTGGRSLRGGWYITGITILTQKVNMRHPHVAYESASELMPLRR